MEYTEEDLMLMAQGHRQERDWFLQASDWTHVTDSALTTEQKAAWASYRQALRDITSQPDFPVAVNWPEKPTI